MSLACQVPLCEGEGAPPGCSCLSPASWPLCCRLQQQIQSYGLTGVIAYGLLNTVYYSGAFLFAWLYIFKVPAGLGPRQAATAFLSVFAAVWAGAADGPAAACSVTDKSPLAVPGKVDSTRLSDSSQPAPCRQPGDQAAAGRRGVGAGPRCGHGPVLAAEGSRLEDQAERECVLPHGWLWSVSQPVSCVPRRRSWSSSLAASPAPSCCLPRWCSCGPETRAGTRDLPSPALPASGAASSG